LLDDFFGKKRRETIAPSSKAIFVALRAWRESCLDNGRIENPLEVKNLIESWLAAPHNYYNNRKYLYTILVKPFNDNRREWEYYQSGVFNFQTNEYKQSWDALKDIDKVAKLSGYEGLVVLVDEFEDVIYNLKNRKLQQDAFRNLFHFFSQEFFPALSFFAVTPNFVEKCKEVLFDKSIWEYDFSRFDNLEKFEMSPLTIDELDTLSTKIVYLHEQAYGWKMDDITKDKVLKTCQTSSFISTSDRVRQTIKNITKILDESLSE